VQNRVGRFIDWLAGEDPSANVVVVAHGGSVRAMRNYCAGRPVQEMAWDDVPNGSVWPVSLPTAEVTAAAPSVRPEKEGEQ
jgi:broad specificity phosphatase PhoE